MNGSDRITRSPGSPGGWSTAREPGPASVASEPGPQPRLGREGLPGRPPPHLEPGASTLQPRHALPGTRAGSSTGRSGSPSIWKALASIGGKCMAAPSHAPRSGHLPATLPIDLARLDTQPGQLARSALLLALEHSGQTVELRLTSPSEKPPLPFAERPTERVIRLRHDARIGVIVDMVRPNLPSPMTFAASGLGISGRASRARLIDELSAHLDKVSGMGSFALSSACINPPAPPATGLTGPRDPSPLTDAEKALVGVARWPDPAHNTEHTEQQQAYGRLLWATSRDAGSQIARGRIGSFLELWTYARDWRGSLAGDPAGRIFGLASARTATQRRDMDNISALIDQYRYIRDRYEHRSGGVIEPSMFPGVIPDSVRFQAMDSIQGQPIALTTIVMSTDPSADRHAPAYQALRELGYEQFSEPFHIEYTPVPESQRIMDHVESLYRHATDPAVKPAQALATIAELHWWLSHGMPDQRGSAAKAELSVRSIAQARGIDLPPLQHGIVLDLEAMTTSRADFVQNYTGYFIRHPELPD